MLELWEMETKNVNPNRSGFRMTNRRGAYWSDRVIPYQINSIHPRDEQTLIKAGMREWEKWTCLEFRPKRRDDTNWITYDYDKDDGCLSLLGKGWGEQFINLESPGCTYMSTVLHEIGHALGMNHEHQHPYRDEGIYVNLNNVKSDWKRWFNKDNAEDLTFFGVDYDMDSLMHYSSYAFTRDHKLRTMETKDPELQFRLDNYHKPLSFSDVLIVNRMLKCEDLCRGRKPSCPDGYVDRNCKCHTPKEFYDLTCKNTESDDWCMQQASSGGCRRKDVVEKCTKMCDLCAMYKVPRKRLTGGCENKHQDDSECDKWQREGRCDDFKYKRFLAGKCAKSCNLCGVKPECIDDNKDCPHFPDKDCRSGSRFYSYMMDHCRDRCGYCGSSGGGRGNNNNGRGNNNNGRGNNNNGRGNNNNGRGNNNNGRGNNNNNNGNVGNNNNNGGKSCKKSRQQHAGLDYRQISNQTYRQCRAACLADTKCAGATSDTRNKVCYLHEAVESSRIYKSVKDHVLFIKDCSKGQECKDKYHNCNRYEKNDYCDQNSRHYTFMSTMCQKFCGFCRG